MTASPSRPRKERLPGLRARQAQRLIPLAGVALLAGLAVVSLGVGSNWIDPGDVLRTLAGGPTRDLHEVIVTDLRLPRILVAALAGAMLGLAGAMLQTIARNGLAAPELVGVSAGIVLLNVLWVAYGPAGVRTGRLVPAIALFGGIGAGLVVYGLSRRGRSDPVRLILVGVLITVILQAATSVVVLLNQGATGGVVIWAVGSLNGRTWTHWATLWPWGAVCIALGLGSAAAANLLQLSDDTAGALGLAREPARGLLLLIAATLTAGAVAVVGAIGFIGLIAPHIARRLVGDDARRLFPTTTVTGALLLLSADTLARGLAGPAPLPTGAITAIMGSLFFLHLLRSHQYR